MNKKSMMMAAMAASIVTMFSSCATILGGMTAAVNIDGKATEPLTITTSLRTYENVELPAKVKVDRKHLTGQHIKIASPNYVYEDIVLDRRLNGLTILNILLGGVIGLGIDLGTNAVSQPGQDIYYIKATPKKQNTEAVPKEEE